MDIQEALQIVIDLAKARIASQEEKFSTNQEAINMVEDLIVNQFGDD